MDSRRQTLLTGVERRSARPVHDGCSGNPAAYRFAPAKRLRTSQPTKNVPSPEPDCQSERDAAIAFRIRWSRRVADINTHYPWIPAFAGMTDRKLSYHLN